MFLKETKAKRKSGRVVTYLQLVSSYWDKERKIPRHKVVCNLGRLDRLDKNEIQSLVDKLSSYLDEPRVKPDDLLKLGRTLEFGIPYLVEGVWKKLKLDRFFKEEPSISGKDFASWIQVQEKGCLLYANGRS